MSTGDRGGPSVTGEEEMEDHEEMQEDSLESSDVTMITSHGTFMRERQTVRLLKIGIPRNVTVLLRTCPRTYRIDTFRSMGWSLPNGSKMLYTTDSWTSNTGQTYLGFLSQPEIRGTPSFCYYVLFTGDIKNSFSVLGTIHDLCVVCLKNCG
jgi:hypothetical protein